MDASTVNENLLDWLTRYGSVSLFVLLIFGIVALPIPEETLMVFSGALIKKGGLPLISTLIAGYAGSMCGITVSYLIGSVAGTYVLDKLEKSAWIKKHMHQVHRWFDRFGKWTLLIGYFIPGIRHFTGFSAGVMKMPFRKFALFAYTGSLLWVSFFISLGFFFGGYCFSFLEELDLDTTTIIALGLAAFLLLGIIVKFKSKFLSRK